MSDWILYSAFGLLYSKYNFEPDTLSMQNAKNELIQLIMRYSSSICGKCPWLIVIFTAVWDTGFSPLFSKTCLKWPLSKRPKIGFQDQLSLNAGQKYCRMLQGEHSAILSTFIKLPFVIKIFVSCGTGFTMIHSGQV